MAETEERSLDDFFAKRDKKKRKEKGGRGGVTAAASSAVSSNTAASASSGAGGGRQADGGSGAATGVSASARTANKEEDDWKEFEQEEIDYSGLRVQSMQISEKDDEEGEKREEPRDNSEEPGGGVDKSSGPWNRSAPTQTPVAEIIENPEPVQSSGVYRPPGARETRTRKAPQGPPEIYSDTQFPSLQATAKHVDTRKLHQPSHSNSRKAPLLCSFVLRAIRLFHHQMGADIHSLLWIGCFSEEFLNPGIKTRFLTIKTISLPNLAINLKQNLLECFQCYC